MVASRPSLALAVVALLALAGCSGPPGTTTVSTTSSGATNAMPATTATTATSNQRRLSPARGTQFVSVDPAPPEGEGVVFENLSEPRRELFLRALREGQVRFGPGEDPPFSFHNESRPRYVRYNGVWYHVRVAIV